MIPLLLQFIIAVSGVWNAWDYNPGEWDELAPLLSEKGYDTVFYCAAYGPMVDREGLRECIESCGEYGIDVHAWVVMWKTDVCPDSMVESFRRQERMQVSIQGDENPGTWLCPWNPENVELMASICLDLASEFPVKGIHLDYIRYPSNRNCFCSACREGFDPWRNVLWPDDCYYGGDFFREYTAWRGDVITSAVAAVRDSLSRINRVVELSAAVLPDNDSSGYFAQNWKDWLDRNLVDFVVAMNYTQSLGQLDNWAGDQLPPGGSERILCGLITHREDYQLTAEELDEQKSKALRLGYGGTVVFHLSNYFVSLHRD